MNVKYLWIVFMCSFTLFLQCKKETIDVSLPDEVAIGETVVYFNGEITNDYKPDFLLDSFNHLLDFRFIEIKGDITNSFAFDWLPIKEGDFQLHTERIPYIKAYTGFAQVIGLDSEGYEYKLIDAEEGYFNIERLDTIKMEVQGQFRAKFKRTSKNRNRNLGLPKYIQVDGVFNEPYTFF